MGKEKGRKPYTGFGRTLRKLMWARDVASWTTLCEMIEETTGRHFAHQSMSKYAAGTTPAPHEFVQAFAETLDLTTNEREQLAYQYTFFSTVNDPAKNSQAS